MLETIDKIEYKNYIINVFYDDCPVNPYIDYDHVGFMVHWHKGGFAFGDDISNQDSDDIQDLIDRTEAAGGEVFPIYLYDHGIQTISLAPFSCRWDSGTVGLWIIEHDDLKKEWPKQSKQHATRYVEAVVNELNSYLTGAVYGYIITDKKGNEVDSCWGFFGDYEAESGMIESCKDSIDCMASTARVERNEKLKSLIKNNVPLIYRESQLNKGAIK